jgi:ribose 5-phosphate isomerase A
MIFVDYRKKSTKLGTEWTKGVPIEVVPMTYKSVMKSIDTRLSLKPITSKLRMVSNYKIVD